jgi:predicted transposase/invertase (TIGR01784 family)
MIDGSAFTDLIKIVTLELPKVPQETDRNGAWPWARFFTCKEEEEFDMLAKEYPEVGKVVGVLKKLSWGERRRMIAEQEEIWRKDRAAMADDARAEGRERGRAEGREKGMAEGIAIGTEKTRREEQEKAYREKLEAARRLKAKGLSVELIAESLELPHETVEGL